MALSSQAAGRAHEAWVEAQHREALRLGLLAFLPQHNQPEVRKIGGRLVRARRSVSDWTGALARGARTLAVEAKSTAGGRLARRAVRPLQARYMDAVAAAGGLAVLVVEFRVDGGARRFAIPWREVPWSIGRDRLGARAEDFARWEVREGECYLARLLEVKK